MISALERNKTLVDSWLDLHVPQESLCHLERSERLEIGQRRPRSTYDLLPRDLKSSSFVMQFDMETPKARFLILHRSVICEYSELSESDKKELLDMCLRFIQRFKLSDCYLSIPLGDNNFAQEIYRTFHAYLIISDTNFLLKLFSKKSDESVIPAWPTTNRWVTPLWLPDSFPPRDSMCFEESVRFNTSLFPDELLNLISSGSSCISISSDESTASQLPEDFEMISWPDKCVVGFQCRHFDSQHDSISDRWQCLDYMYRAIQPLLTDQSDDICCYMAVSLGAPFCLGEEEHVNGLIEFKHEIPPAFAYMVKSSIVQNNHGLSFWTKLPSLPLGFELDYVEIMHSPGDIYDYWVIVEKNGRSWICKDI